MSRPKTRNRNSRWNHHRITRRNNGLTRIARLSHLEAVRKDDEIWWGFVRMADAMADRIVRFNPFP